MLKDLCTVCKDYKTCKELCDKAETYVNQDFIGEHKNTVWYNEEQGYQAKTYEEIKPVHLTKIERKIIIMLNKTMSTKEICQILEITKETLYNYTSKLRKL
ncbi:hypothetical protein DRQ25_16740 [Candidatus Fermentibacteria bacterium]|nr:MAG: hypothetical protein DRQ25_16740 [Candidatus Fermentibacteria bacterium]